MNLSDKKCWFCNESVIDDSYNLYITLKRQYNVGPYLKTEKTTVSIPRCLTCKGKHDEVNFYAWTRAIIISVIFIFLFFLYFNLGFLTSILFGGVTGLFIGLIIFRFIAEKKYLNGTAPEKKVQKHPKILILKAQGWEIGH